MGEGRASQVLLGGYLDECKALVTEEITRQVGAAAGSMPGLYRLMLDYPLRGGKALRPSLAIAMCRAMGGSLDAVLPTAATLELYHNAFLIHDDVEDESLTRRGRPTLHVEHGVPIAVNVGDAMLCMTLQPLLDNMARIGLGPALRVLEVIAEMTRRSVEGQAVELEWIRENRWDLADDDYTAMVVAKTGWYSFIAPLQIGAIAAGQDAGRVAELEELGRHLSVAFQIADDLLNLDAEAFGYGKEVAGDLWEGKRTLPLLHALRHADPERRDRAVAILARPRPGGALASVRATVEDLVARGRLDDAAAEELRRAMHGTRPPKSAAEVEELAALIDHQGSVPHAAAVAARHADAARAALVGLDWLPDSPHRAMIEALIDFVHERDR